jgi:DNA-binding response OmpR family regulator
MPRDRVAYNGAMKRQELKVLVVDDEAAVIEALKLLFDVHGIPCISAATPEEGLHRAIQEGVGAVVQDMNFGADKTSGEQGVRLFRSLREADPDLPILLITAWVSLETAVSLVKEGAADYMAKPWDDDKLVTTVRNLLEMRRLRTENRDLQQQGGGPGRPWRSATISAASSTRANRCTVSFRSPSTYRAPTHRSSSPARAALGRRSSPRSSRRTHDGTMARSSGSTSGPSPRI